MDCYFNIAIITVKDPGSTRLNKLQNQIELGQILTTNVGFGASILFLTLFYKMRTENLPHRFLHRYREITCRLSNPGTYNILILFLPSTTLGREISCMCVCVCARVQV